MTVTVATTERKAEAPFGAEKIDRGRKRLRRVSKDRHAVEQLAVGRQGPELPTNAGHD